MDTHHKHKHHRHKHHRHFMGTHITNTNITDIHIDPHNRPFMDTHIHHRYTSLTTRAILKAVNLKQLVTEKQQDKGDSSHAKGPHHANI